MYDDKEQNTVVLVAILMLTVTFVFGSFASVAICYRFLFKKGWFFLDTAFLPNMGRNSSCWLYPFPVLPTMCSCFSTSSGRPRTTGLALPIGKKSYSLPAYNDVMLRQTYRTASRSVGSFCDSNTLMGYPTHLLLQLVAVVRRTFWGCGSLATATNVETT